MSNATARSASLIIQLFGFKSQTRCAQELRSNWMAVPWSHPAVPLERMCFNDSSCQRMFEKSPWKRSRQDSRLDNRFRTERVRRHESMPIDNTFRHFHGRRRQQYKFFSFALVLLLLVASSYRLSPSPTVINRHQSLDAFPN